MEICVKKLSKFYDDTIACIETALDYNNGEVTVSFYADAFNGTKAIEQVENSEFAYYDFGKFAPYDKDNEELDSHVFEDVREDLITYFEGLNKLTGNADLITVRAVFDGYNSEGGIYHATRKVFYDNGKELSDDLNDFKHYNK